MATSSFVFDATPENFADLVVQNSRKGPVLVNFWAPWAGPCLKLWPTLEKLAHDYAGRFLLVNLNTDRHKQLARDLGVNSLPTIKIFRHGRVAEQVHGAESEASLRQLIERHLVSAAERAHGAAAQALRAGELDRALELFAAAHRDHPSDVRITVDYCKALLQANDVDEAHSVLASLSQAERGRGPAAVMATHLDLLAVLADGPSAATLDAQLQKTPEDVHLHYQRAGVHLFADEYQEALARLLFIMEREPDFRDHAAQTAMNAVFELLGPTHPLSQRYRTLLQSLLF